MTSGKSSENLEELSESELEEEMFYAMETCYGARDRLEDAKLRLDELKKELKEREGEG